MTPSADQLARLFETADVGWVFDPSTFGEEPAATAARILHEMALVDRVLASKIGLLHPKPVVDSIFSDSARLKPLIQAFASPVTAEMRAMIYCVLDGAEVLSIQVTYERQAHADIRVVVEYESGLQAVFLSDDVWDFEVLRHFGTMKLGDRPVVDGYYAFRKAVH
jgi:hypothetical protein